MKAFRYVTVLLAVAAMAATFVSCDKDNDITGDPMADHSTTVNGKQDYWIDFKLSNAGSLNEEAQKTFTQKIVEVVYPEDWANGVREIKFIEHAMYVTEDYALNNFNAVAALSNSENDIVQKIMIPTAKVQKVLDFAVTMTLSKDSMRTVMATHTWNASECISADALN